MLVKENEKQEKGKDVARKRSVEEKKEKQKREENPKEDDKIY